MITGEIKIQNVSCLKKGGTKYYLDEGTDRILEEDIHNNITQVYSVVNGKAVPQLSMTTNELTLNSSAMEYYKEAKDLYDFIVNSPLRDIKTANIVNNETGQIYGADNPNNPYYDLNKGYIFDFNFANGIDDEQSNFNTHRIEVIKNSIESNLSVAIANYSENGLYDFQMPVLKDTDWDKIMNNISVISFLQGMNIGGKIYNGYSIITNYKNEDVVMPQSIYFEYGDNDNNRTIATVTQRNLGVPDGAIFNINLEARYIEEDDGSKSYYFPRYGMLSYFSIVSRNSISINLRGQKFKDYIINNIGKDEQEKYYTALARERFGLYRQSLKINEDLY